MSIHLIKQVKVYDRSSPFHLKRCDILLEDGRIKEISPEIGESQQSEVKELRGACVSPGWFDMRVGLTVPGFEHRDTFETISDSARAGGFSEIAVLPNTVPVIQHKEGISFIRQSTQHLPVAFHALAAATKDVEGKEMNELFDLHQNGALAFSDGTHPIDDPNLLKDILLYLKGFDSLLINLPTINSLIKGGQMHEGTMSTRLGMKGIPAFVEPLAVQRDLELLRYTGGRIHLSCLSTKESVKLVRAAKTEGLHVSADVSAHHLYFTDESLANFDTDLKVFPPFRDKETVDALWEGIVDGTIDAIVSDHQPLDTESKELEFDLADFGMLGLETAFASIISSKPETTSTEMLIDVLVSGARNVLRKKLPSIKEEAVANLSFFDPEAQWIVGPDHIRSKSNNLPYIGKTLQGKVLGTYFNGTLNIN